MDQEAQFFSSEIEPSPFGAEPPDAPPPITLGEPDYKVPWDDDRRERLGRRLCAQIDAYLSDTSEKRSILEAVRDAYAVMSSMDHTGPHPKSANVNTGVIRWVCNAHQIRLNQQILLASPPFTVVAQDEAAQAAITRIEEALESLIHEAEWPRIGNLTHKELPQAGECLVKCVYEIEHRRVPRRQVDFEPDVTKALMRAGYDPQDAYLEGARKDKQGRIRLPLEFVDILDFAGVRLSVIPWEDLIIMPTTVARAEDAYAIGERVVLTGEALQRGVRAGRYIEEEVEELLKRPSDPPDEGKRLRWDQQGLAPTGTAETVGGYVAADDEDAAPYREYVCYEMCCRLDDNDDGELEWCIATVHKATGRVLRLQYLPWEHGKPHYVMFSFGEEAGKLFSGGVAELIEGLFKAYNALCNQILDHGDYVHNLHGNFFYDKSAGFDPTKMEIALGTPIPVRDVRGIQQITIPPLPAEHYAVLDTLKGMIELLAQVSNPALGRETDQQKTLGEIQIVTAAANQQFEDTASHVARSWAELFDMIRWLAAQFPTQGEVRYRRTLKPRLEMLGPGMQPQDPMGSISVEDLLANVDILPTGQSQLSDASMRLQRAQVMLQTLGTHPLTMENTAVQLIALDDYLQQFHHPQRERIMGEVMRGLQAQVAEAQAQEAEMAEAQAQQQQAQVGAIESGAQAGARDAAMLAPAGEAMTNGAAPPPLGISP